MNHVTVKNFLAVLCVLLEIMISKAALAIDPDAGKSWAEHEPKLLAGLSVGNYTSPIFEKIEDVRYRMIRPDPITSSTLESKDNRYMGSNMRDANVNTAWCEGAEGPGVGQTITIKEDDISGYSVDAVKISILPGYEKNQNVFINNARPKKITLKIYKKGTAKIVAHKIISLADKNQLSVISVKLDSYYDMSDLEFDFNIDDVYSGKKFEDMCITDLRALPDGDLYFKQVLDHKEELHDYETNEFAFGGMLFNESTDMGKYNYGLLFAMTRGFMYNDMALSEGNFTINSMFESFFAESTKGYFYALMHQSDELINLILNVTVIGNIAGGYTDDDMYNAAIKLRNSGFRYPKLDELISVLEKIRKH